MHDVVDDVGNVLDGSLALGMGSFDRAGNPANDATLLIDANGTLVDSAGRNLVVGAQLEGDFLATDHRGVGGVVLGSVMVEDVDQNLDGGFIAER